MQYDTRWDQTVIGVFSIRRVLSCNPLGCQFCLFVIYDLRSFLRSCLYDIALFYTCLRGFKKFREEGRNGVISFKRGLFYCLRVYFNAALIFSLLQWLYMNYVDNGRLLAVFTTIYSTPEAKQMYNQLNVSYNDVIRLLSMMTEPTVLAANSFITAVLSGVVFSLIIAALMMKQVRTSNSKQY